MEHTKEGLENLQDYMEQLIEDCKDILIWESIKKGEILKKGFYVGDLEIHDISENTISLSADEYWAYGGHECHYYEVPFRALYDLDGWKEEYVNELNTKKLEAKQVREKIGKEKLEKERQQYEELKKKFG